MARPVDPEIRPKILNTCAQVALSGNLRELSLAKLSQAVGVSPRMLIYHFGSAEALVEETLRAVQLLMRAQLESSLIQDPTRDARKALRRLWDLCVSPQMLPFFRSYYFFVSESLGNPQAYAKFIDFSINGLVTWIKSCLQDHQPALREADHTLVSGVLRGLLIDCLATGDLARTTAAYQDFLDHFHFGAV